VDCHKVVTQREAKFTNFVEWRTHKLVYRCEVAANVRTQSHASHALIPVNAAMPVWTGDTRDYFLRCV
jgi:hypothetical protein